MEESSGRVILCGARELVARSWCQGADARDSDGNAVDPWDEQAASWSLLGALVAVLERDAAQAGALALGELAAALSALAELLDADSLAAWNDEQARTQLEVVTLLDRAAAVGTSGWQFSATLN